MWRGGGGGGGSRARERLIGGSHYLTVADCEGGDGREGRGGEEGVRKELRLTYNRCESVFYFVFFFPFLVGSRVG